MSERRDDGQNHGQNLTETRCITPFSKSFILRVREVLTRDNYSEREIVEITWLNAVHNYYNLINLPLEIESDGPVSYTHLTLPTILRV